MRVSLFAGGGRVGRTFLYSTLLLTAVRYCVAADPTVEFNRDIRPILADHCFQCHGPDANQRQAELRLDIPNSAAPGRDGGPVVVAGLPEKSEVWRRIIATDPDERMPPPNKGRPLNNAELAAIRQWILQGAQWQKHWSLLPVRRPELPAVAPPGSPRGPLDTFILARLAADKLSPSPEADRSTLLRRATLALTGLPPTADEIDSHVADPSPDAYERAVDRLLASPRYGERMAVPWLDAARYADTSGYQSDGERYMWRWRDWVIDALNSNMPFDQFTIEQLAGDLLPQPTLDQRIATGFNRNHRGNAEGGIIPEEYAVEYVADRVETTATVWLGLTLGCCRCHDHKYDPFSQREFYSLFAFFNNVPEKGRAIKIGNSPPYIPAPTPRQAEQLAVLEQQAGEAHATFAALSNEIGTAQRLWERSARLESSFDWYPTEKLVAHLPLDSDSVERVRNERATLNEGSVRYVAGPIRQAAELDDKAFLDAGDIANFGFFDKFTLSAWIRVPPGGGGTVISRMVDAAEGEGYQFVIAGGKLQLNLVKRWLDDALRVETAESLQPGAWHHVAATYDGSRVADGVQIYIDGRPQKLVVLLDELNQTFASKQPLRIGGGGGRGQRFRGAIDEVRVYQELLSPEQVLILSTSQSIAEIVGAQANQRSEGQRLKLRMYFLEHHAPPAVQASYRTQISAAKELATFRESLPTVMVMEEMPTPRTTHVLLRGQYDKPGERVQCGVPAELPQLPASAPRNRLGLAKWLVDPAHPLTSRVTVNRIWQLHFGTGLVKTSEDFGRQGEWPSHPQLLDWLANEFLSDWDLKRLHRIIVTSATFRQSSKVTPEMVARDPENRLLARAPRLRLPAEMVRDQALSASGLLVEQLGGPSVRPAQPPGLWSELTGGDDYRPGDGAELVRRSLYTFWKRTIPPPTLATFDAPTREFCMVRESRTNTPLQALAMLNEKTSLAAARGLAERVMREASKSRDRIERAVMLVIGRRPTDEELTLLERALVRYRGHYENHPKEADKAIGSASASAGPPAELAAYALVCSTILNLDEAVTRQ
jgi:mono/diheme cytochrome c family protein